MSLLITGGDSPFARTLAAALAATYSIRLFDQQFSAPRTGLATHTGDLRNPDDVTAALQGIDTIIHLLPFTIAQQGLDDVSALDLTMRGSYVLVNAARAAGVQRLILASSLAIFDRWPAHYQVNEQWRPRPEPALTQLCPWLGELSVRENLRLGTIQGICLRFGQIVTEEQAATQPYDPRWLHSHDAIHGIEQALRYKSERRPDWSIFHITAPGTTAKIRLQYQASAQAEFGYQPQHDFAQQARDWQPPVRDERPWRTILAPTAPIPSRPIHQVVIFGAGGPMGTAATQELLSSYQVRVTDLRPLATIQAENKPQAPGAPLPTPLTAPHSEMQVDVRDPEQVLAATAGMDAIINCTVVRPHPVDAFLVNAIGAYNVMKAAVAHGIRRVVHTGPLVQHLRGPGDYSWDYDLHVDAPARPFDHLYIHSKYLGQEIVRVFAEAYDLETPVLLFTMLYNPDPAIVPTGYSLFTISWPDTGRALRRALEVTALPSPYVMVNISADLPHGRFNHDKARSVLDWSPRDAMAHFWQESAG